MTSKFVNIMARLLITELTEHPCDVPEAMLRAKNQLVIAFTY